MEILWTPFEVVMRLAGLREKPVAYADWDAKDDWDEICKAAPWLSRDDIIHEEAYLLFDSEGECGRIYNETVGDDGPTATNPYAGRACVYMMTSMGNENT